MSLPAEGTSTDEGQSVQSSIDNDTVTPSQSDDTDTATPLLECATAAATLPLPNDTSTATLSLEDATATAMLSLEDATATTTLSMPSNNDTAILSLPDDIADASTVDRASSESGQGVRSFTGHQNVSSTLPENQSMVRDHFLSSSSDDQVDALSQQRFELLKYMPSMSSNEEETGSEVDFETMLEQYSFLGPSEETHESDEIGLECHETLDTFMDDDYFPLQEDGISTSAISNVAQGQGGNGRQWPENSISGAISGGVSYQESRNTLPPFSTFVFHSINENVSHTQESDQNSTENSGDESWGIEASRTWENTNHAESLGSSSIEKTPPTFPVPDQQPVSGDPPPKDKKHMLPPQTDKVKRAKKPPPPSNAQSGSSPEKRAQLHGSVSRRLTFNDPANRSPVKIAAVRADDPELLKQMERMARTIRDNLCNVSRQRRRSARHITIADQFRENWKSLHGRSSQFIALFFQKNANLKRQFNLWKNAMERKQHARLAEEPRHQAETKNQRLQASKDNCSTSSDPSDQPSTSYAGGSNNSDTTFSRNYPCPSESSRNPGPESQAGSSLSQTRPSPSTPSTGPSPSESPESSRSVSQTSRGSRQELTSASPSKVLQGLSLHDSEMD